MTREEWLTQAVDLYRPYFEAEGHTIPDEIKISVGWSKGAKKGTLGTCWASTSSEDKKSSHIFITPEVRDEFTVLAILAHELVHAVDDCSSQHKGAFIRIAKSIGLLPKWTATTAGPDLIVQIDKMGELLPLYPHVKLVPGTKIAKQTTRMIKVQCYEDEYTVRMTRKWLDEMGAPVCPCGRTMEEM